MFSVTMANKLHVFYQNTRGLRTKTQSFFHSLTSTNYDVICLAETWLKTGVLSSELFTSEYDVFRRDREDSGSVKKDGGGVLVAVKSEWQASRCVELESDAEDVWISIQNSAGEKSYICCAYIPPADNSALLSFSNNLFNFKGLLSERTAIIVGDFNLPNIRWVNMLNENFLQPTQVDSRSSSLIDILSYSEFLQYNNVRNSNDKVLDLILCNRDMITNVTHTDAPLVEEDPHHASLEFYFKIESLKPLEHSNNKLFNFNKADYTNINRELADVDWNSVLAQKSLTEIVNSFYLILENIIQKYVPSFIVSGKYPVYFKADTIKTIKEKNKFHRKYKQYNDKASYLIFSQLRRRSKQLMKRDYSSFTSTIELQISSKAKKFWKYVSSKKKSSVTIPQSLRYEGRTASDGASVSNLFADYFKNVYEPSNVHSKGTRAPMKNISIHITKEKIIDIIKCLDLQKSPGPDGIPPVFIKNCMFNITTPLLIIYKLSLESCTFPERWKLSHIVPIHKSGDRTDVANYRPISKISIFAKMLEKIVYEDILITAKNIIIEEQHGFCPQKSLETNLLCFSHHVCNTIDNQGQMDCVYTDFSKAFDKINHRRLIERLAGVGVSAGLLEWVWSYICNRKQVAVVNGYYSEPFISTSGVPQGSHLGPLLFIIYINSIKDCFINTKFLLYADDLKIFRTINDLSDCQKLQDDLDRLLEYCVNNSLFLNLKKCNSITFSKKKNLINFEYTINKNVLTKVDEIKDLGLILDAQWTFRSHYENLINDTNRMLGFITRTCKDFRNPRSLLTLYYSYIHSKLSFASIIWNPHYNIHIQRLESIQKKFLKSLAFKTRSSVEDTAKQYKLLPLAKKRIISDLCFTFKIINNIIDSPFLLSRMDFKVPGRELRSSELFNIPLRRTN